MISIKAFITSWNAISNDQIRESLSLSRRGEKSSHMAPPHTHTHSDASSYSFLIRCVMKDSWRPLINRYFARPANTEVPLFFSHLPVIKLLLTHDDSYQNRQQQQRNTKKKNTLILKLRFYINCDWRLMHFAGNLTRKC